MKLSLKETTIALCFITILFEAGFVAKVVSTLNQADEAMKQERRARDVIAHVLMISVDLENAVMGFFQELDLKDPPKSQQFRETYSDHVDQIFKEISEIKSLVKNNRSQIRQIEELENTCKDEVAFMERCRKRVALEDNPFMGISAAKVMLIETMGLVAKQSEDMKDTFSRLQSESLKVHAVAREQLFKELAAGLGLNIAVIVWLAVLFNRNISQRLRVLGDNSTRLAAGVPLTPILEGDDEIAAADSAFHKMAEQLRDAALRERAVVENALDLICSLDVKGKFLSVNSAAMSILGRSADALIGGRFIDLVVEADRERTLAFFAKIGSESCDGELEIRLLRADLSSVYLLFSVRWSTDAQSFFCVGHDVSERRSIERLKQEFVSMVSHDLKAPLSSIKGTLDLISEGIIQPETKFGEERLHDAQGSVQRLMLLVDDLLYLERMESGKLQVKHEPVRLADVVRRALESVRFSAEQLEVSIKTGDTDMVVIGDEERLVQVLVNLLANAIKFSPAQSAVSVNCVRSKGNAEVRVIDKGPGIPAAAKDQLFERFKQLDSQDGKRREGTGLGLSICKAIIDAHAGQIGVESEDGSGSTFWFKVPLSAVQG